jgi:hypothetical protein
MRFSLLLLTAEVATASSWFGKTVYNKWHETELERWLSDNNVPYPTPADRKDLENLIKNNWNDYIVTPYNSWDANQLSKYLTAKGEEIQKGAEKNKDALVSQVKASWSDTEDKANEAYGSTKDWIFDSWSDSQLKAFADRNGIPVPQPRTRDVLLKNARENYQIVANKANEYTAYPGNWLWASWSDSDLKAWCDERGINVPQNGKRDQLIASVRRNSRVASDSLAAWSASVSSKAASATDYISDAIFDTWSDSQLKKYADEKGIKVPQGSKRNEIIALARRKNAQLSSEAARVSASAASAFGAATSSAGNEYASVTADAALKYQYAQSAFFSYVDWLKLQIGIASATASSAASGASKEAYKSASSASKSASSAYTKASKAASAAASAGKAEL